MSSSTGSQLGKIKVWDAHITKFMRFVAAREGTYLQGPGNGGWGTLTFRCEGSQRGLTRAGNRARSHQDTGAGEEAVSMNKEGGMQGMGGNKAGAQQGSQQRLLSTHACSHWPLRSHATRVGELAQWAESVLLFHRTGPEFSSQYPCQLPGWQYFLLDSLVHIYSQYLFLCLSVSVSVSLSHSLTHAQKRIKY